jgi:predicted AAA+ superfamily ATPase
MKTFKVFVNETITGVLFVGADNEADAKDKVQQLIDDGDFPERVMDDSYGLEIVYAKEVSDSLLTRYIEKVDMPQE